MTPCDRGQPKVGSFIVGVKQKALRFNDSYSKISASCMTYFKERTERSVTLNLAELTSLHRVIYLPFVPEPLEPAETSQPAQEGLEALLNVARAFIFIIRLLQQQQCVHECVCLCGNKWQEMATSNIEILILVCVSKSTLMGHSVNRESTNSVNAADYFMISGF